MKAIVRVFFYSLEDYLFYAVHCLMELVVLLYILLIIYVFADLDEVYCICVSLVLAMHYFFDDFVLLQFKIRRMVLIFKDFLAYSIQGYLIELYLADETESGAVSC
jgi:hypothetical protein